MDLTFLGYAGAQRRITAREGHTIDLGLVRLAREPLDGDAVTVARCTDSRKAPRDTAGASVHEWEDSLGTVWSVCRDPRRK